jgi:hypothetical protein
VSEQDETSTEEAPTAEEGPKSLVELISEASASFDAQVQARHDLGAEKYGPVAFLGKNTVEEAMHELLDLANYARYTYIKMYLLAFQLEERLGGDAPPGGFQASQPRMSPSTPRFYGS